MTEHIKQIIEFLQKTIDDAVSRLTGKGSILDYGMWIRRQIAENIFCHIQSPTGTKSATRPCVGASSAITPYADVEIDLGLRNGLSAGVGNLHAAATRANTCAGIPQ
ncbi:MAG TPA: hypothetical protein VFA53_06440 [Xanthobacteraceae bacterium]|nr:hypothetical protein [Xanthobacteraceae bacterium]